VFSIRGGECYDRRPKCGPSYQFILSTPRSAPKTRPLGLIGTYRVRLIVVTSFGFRCVLRLRQTPSAISRPPTQRGGGFTCNQHCTHAQRGKPACVPRGRIAERGGAQARTQRRQPARIPNWVRELSLPGSLSLRPARSTPISAGNAPERALRPRGARTGDRRANAPVRGSGPLRPRVHSNTESAKPSALSATEHGYRTAVQPGERGEGVETRAVRYCHACTRAACECGTSSGNAPTSRMPRDLSPPHAGQGTGCSAYDGHAMTAQTLAQSAWQT
jgi:hypothetical protein